MHTYYWHRWLTHLHRANSYVIPSLDVRIQLETPRGQYSTCRQAISVLSLRRSSYPKSDQIDCIYSMCLWLRVLHAQTNSNILLLITYLSRKYLTRASNKRFYKNTACTVCNTSETAQLRFFCSQRSQTSIWILCKTINPSSFLAPTTFHAEYCLPFIFWPKLTHPSARYLCDNWAT